MGHDSAGNVHSVLEPNLPFLGRGREVVLTADPGVHQQLHSQLLDNFQDPILRVEETENDRMEDTGDGGEVHG